MNSEHYADPTADEAIGNIARYCCDYRTGIFPPQHELHGELDKEYTLEDLGL